MHRTLITFEDWETVRKYSKLYCVQAEAYESYAGEKREDDAGENGARQSASVVRPERGRRQEELAPPTAIVSVESHCCRKKLFLKCSMAL
ncbi:hypothetical protein QYF36_022653 [Acer negundo]|nr:hypothetical protein QYF36_022653 [Acer negundo]